jgi:PKD repeat protein
MKDNFFHLGLVFISLLIPLIAQSQCTGSAGQDRIICRGTTVTLTAIGGVAYSWDTGFQTQSIDVSPQETTDYIVQITCSVGNTIADTVTVFVNPLPIINLGNDKQICIGDSTTITANNGMNFLWSNTTTTNKITVSPAATTEYWVLITDINNCQNSDTIQIVVNSLPIVQASPDQSICPYDSTILTASSGAAQYLWSTGETTSVITVNPLYTSIYTVTVTDLNGCRNSDTAVITVKSQPVADFAFTEDCVYNPIHFSNLSSPNGSSIIERKWLFDDGTYSTLENPEHFFEMGGVHNTTLIVVTSNGCQDTVTKSSQVFPQPNARFTSSIDSTCQNPAIVEFTDMSSDAIQWNWSFGNSQTSILQNPQTIYNSAGDYNVSLIVVSDKNCTDTTSKLIKIFQKPTVNFIADHTEGCEPFKVNFLNQSVNYDTCFWYMDNQIIPSKENVNYVFEGEGSYNITLKVQNQHCSNTYTKQNYITVYLKPTSSFTFTPDSVCGYPYTLSMVDQSVNAINWNWNFANGDSSTIQSPNVTYDSAGVFNIRQIVYSGHLCSDTTTKIFKILQNPVVDFNSDHTIGCEPLNVRFTNQSQYSDFYHWELDNHTYTDTNIDYSFYGEGLYTIYLRAKNKNGCIRDTTKEFYITVLNTPQPDFTWVQNLDPIPHGDVFFTNTTSYGNKYYWDFGDSTFSETESPSHKYDEYGILNVMLVAYDTLTQCSDTLITSVEVEYYDGLFVPNAFVPEHNYGDASLFLPKGKHLMTYSIKIFNNLGNLLWQSDEINNSNPATGWDGIYKGKPMPPGVYFWKIDAVFENGEKWKGQINEKGKYQTFGTLTLIR